MMSNVRRVEIPVPARRLFAAVQSVSPSLAARFAEQLFFRPPRSALSHEGKQFLHSGRRFEVEADGRRVIGYAWGSGEAVYLVHGWGSRGARMGALAKPLVEAGFNVVTFDAPGHGESGGGLSSMPDFARAMRAVAQRNGPARAVIAHSLGASAAALAARWGLAAERFAMLAPAADPVAFADAFGVALGARPDVMERMRANSERRLRFSWSDLDARVPAKSMTAPLLVVHDAGDDVVPFDDGAALAASWPGARLIRTAGLGHRGVLRDPGVIDQVVQFVTGPAADRRQHARTQRTAVTASDAPAMR